MKILSMKDVGQLVVTTRKAQKATQIELAQFANAGTRFVRDVEDVGAFCGDQVMKERLIVYLKGERINFAAELCKRMSDEGVPSPIYGEIRTVIKRHIAQTRP